ncbi:protein kinase [Streptomyces sp. DSM 116494]|uniref:serine/threonine-protein kinase n=1 Tax=Streptomyces okerensis TaxID=3344655 RepID=UPI00388DDBED
MGSTERYELAKKLGEGGMGEVWSGYDTRLDRKVAVKYVWPPTAPDARRRAEERFRREARITARLEHPAVPTVYDMGTSEDGRMFLVMQLVEGRTLSDLLKADGPYPVARAAGIAAQVSEVLAYAHRLGVVHRDLKPANLMVTRQGQVKVLDFGIAAVLEPDPDEPVLTRPGSPIGTPGFIAPERFNGQRATPRSDLYEFGCVLYQLLAGQPPFVGSPQEVFYLHAVRELPPLADRRPDAPPEFTALVERLLAKDPEQRPERAEEIFRAVAPLLPGRDGAPAHAHPVLAPVGGWPPAWYDPAGHYALRCDAQVPSSGTEVPRRQPAPKPSTDLLERLFKPRPAPADAVRSSTVTAAPRRPSAPPPPRTPVPPRVLPDAPTRTAPAPADGSPQDPRETVRELAAAGRYAQAADQLDALLSAADLPATDPTLLKDRIELLGYRRLAGELQLAYDGYFSLGAALRSKRPARDPYVLMCRAGTARCLRELGRTAEALVEYEALLPHLRAVFGPAAAEVIDTRYWIAVLHAGAGEVQLARAELKALCDEPASVFPAEHRLRGQAAALIARLDRLADR